MWNRNWKPEQSVSDGINMKTIKIDAHSIAQFDSALNDLLDETKIELASRSDNSIETIRPPTAERRPTSVRSEKEKFVNSPTPTPRRNSPFNFTNTSRKVDSSSSIDTGDGGFFTDVIRRKVVTSPAPPPVIERSASNEWKQLLTNRSVRSSAEKRAVMSPAPPSPSVIESSASNEGKQLLTNRSTRSSAEKRAVKSPAPPSPSVIERSASNEGKHLFTNRSTRSSAEKRAARSPAPPSASVIESSASNEGKQLLTNRSVRSSAEKRAVKSPAPPSPSVIESSASNEGKHLFTNRSTRSSAEKRAARSPAPPSASVIESSASNEGKQLLTNRSTRSSAEKRAAKSPAPPSVIDSSASNEGKQLLTNRSTRSSTEKRAVKSPAPPSPPAIERSASNEGKQLLTNRSTRSSAEKHQVVPNLVSLRKTSIESLSRAPPKRSTNLEETRSYIDDQSRPGSSLSSASLPVSIISSKPDLITRPSIERRSKVVPQPPPQTTTKKFRVEFPKKSSPPTIVPMVIEGKKVKSARNSARDSDDHLQQSMNSTRSKVSSGVQKSQNVLKTSSTSSMTSITRDDNMLKDESMTITDAHLSKSLHRRSTNIDREPTKSRKMEYSVKEGLKWQQASSE
jgi:hypothetical protein